MSVWMKGMATLSVQLIGHWQTSAVKDISIFTAGKASAGSFTFSYTKIIAILQVGNKASCFPGTWKKKLNYLAIIIKNIWGADAVLIVDFYKFF